MMSALGLSPIFRRVLYRLLTQSLMLGVDLCEVHSTVLRRHHVPIMQNPATVQRLLSLYLHAAQCTVAIRESNLIRRMVNNFNWIDKQAVSAQCRKSQFKKDVHPCRPICFGSQYRVRSKTFAAILPTVRVNSLLLQRITLLMHQSSIMLQCIITGRQVSRRTIWRKLRCVARA